MRIDIVAFKILNTAIERILNQELSEFDITFTQATVIGFLHLNRNNEICQKDIERALGLTHPTMSSILSRLQEKNLIFTEPLESDRRYKKIVLTDKSSGIAEVLQNKINQISDRVFEGMSEKELETLTGFMIRLIDNVI